MYLIINWSFCPRWSYFTSYTSNVAWLHRCTPSYSITSTSHCRLFLHSLYPQGLEQQSPGISLMVSMPYLPVWLVQEFYVPCDDIIFVPLSTFPTSCWYYNWHCWTLVPSIIKTHQSDKPILNVATKFIRYGLWATPVHSVGLHLNSVEGSCSCWLCCFKSSPKRSDVALSWASDTWITVSDDEI